MRQELPEILTPLDLYFADLHPASESERIFYAALMATSRLGHLCLDLEHIPLEGEWKKKVIEGSKTASSPYIRQHGGLFYLEKNYTYETRILERLQQLSFSVTPIPLPENTGLTEEQEEAIKLALSNTITLIEGGPGTGKTFLTSQLVRAFGPNVILMAPTGKAALRLKQFNPEAICGTLHAILGIKSPRHLARGSSFVKADLIIVDESSMIDAKLFAFFLSSIEIGQRVVFLGDGNQLPPVDSGSLFGDLVDLLPTAHLKKCLRSDRVEIVQKAQDVLAGKTITADYPLSEEIILKHTCILSPIREGPFGVNVLNKKILHRKMSKGEAQQIPIMITKTDYEAELYNGEMGILHKTYAEFNGRKIPVGNLPPYELGYVLTVHKSQGNEFDDVLVVLPPGSEAFGREVLYTAITRARHSVKICSDAETLEKTISRSSRRRSGLKSRFYSRDGT